jgi:hypothetical protein
MSSFKRPYDGCLVDPVKRSRQGGDVRTTVCALEEPHECAVPCTIDMFEELLFLKSTAKTTLTEFKSKRVATIKLPNVFSSITAPAARLSLFLNSNIPKQADDWTKRCVHTSISSLSPFANAQCSVLKLNNKSFARHRKAQVTLLAAGFVPKADAYGYRIMCDFMEWVFYFDDLFDEGHLRKDPTAARDEVQAHLAIHSPNYPDIYSKQYPVRYMYQVLWRKIQGISSSGAQGRYVQGMRHYFEGCIVQVDAYY